MDKRCIVIGNGISLRRQFRILLSCKDCREYDIFLCNRGYELAPIFGDKVKYVGVVDKVEMVRILKLFCFESETGNAWDNPILKKFIVHESCNDLTIAGMRYFFPLFWGWDNINTGLHLIRQALHEGYYYIHCFGFDSNEADLWGKYHNNNAANMAKERKIFLDNLSITNNCKIIFHE